MINLKNKSKLYLLFGLLMIFINFTYGCNNVIIPDDTKFGYEPFNEYFYNPLRTEYFMGDPWMFKHEDNYYYSHSTGIGVTITKSPTITGMMYSQFDSIEVFSGSLYSLTDVWAPELFFYNGRWYCYFAADYDYNNDLHRMYALQSKTEDAMGEWEFLGKIELPDDQWAIDGTFFENNDGKIYIVWSGWKDITEGSNPGGIALWKQNLYICELENPYTVKEDSQRIMISEPNLDFENTVLPQNEGMTVTKSPDKTVYCYYSANFSKSNLYALGMLKLSGDPLIAENWVKSNEPLLKYDRPNGIYGPGHCSVVKSKDDTEDWIIFHSAKYSNAGWDRVMRAQKIEWVNDTPVVNPIYSNNELIKLPSGEEVDRIKYEAENYVLKKNMIKVEDAGASGGKAVKSTDTDSEIEFKMTVKKEGNYVILIRYYRDQVGNPSIKYIVNNTSSKRIYLASSNGKFFTMSAIIVGFNEGENLLSLQLPADTILDLLLIQQ